MDKGRKETILILGTSGSSISKGVHHRELWWAKKVRKNRKDVESCGLESRTKKKGKSRGQTNVEDGRAGGDPPRGRGLHTKFKKVVSS